MANLSKSGANATEPNEQTQPPFGRLTIRSGDQFDFTQLLLEPFANKIGMSHVSRPPKIQEVT